MLLSAYVLVPGSHFGAMWRHPYSETDFCDRVLYENLARSLDRYGYAMATCRSRLLFLWAMTATGRR